MKENFGSISGHVGILLQYGAHYF